MIINENKISKKQRLNKKFYRLLLLIREKFKNIMTDNFTYWGLSPFLINLTLVLIQFLDLIVKTCKDSVVYIINYSRPKFENVIKPKFYDFGFLIYDNISIQNKKRIEDYKSILLKYKSLLSKYLIQKVVYDYALKCLIFIIKHYYNWKYKGNSQLWKKDGDDQKDKIIINPTFGIRTSVIELVTCISDYNDKVFGKLKYLWWIPFLSNLHLFKLLGMFAFVRIVELFEYDK